MYPTINTGSGGPPFTPSRYQQQPAQPQQSNPQHSSPFPVAQQQSSPSPFPVYGNGPSTVSGSPSSAFPLLRVHIAEVYRTDPPVSVIHWHRGSWHTVLGGESVPVSALLLHRSWWAAVKQT